MVYYKTLGRASEEGEIQNKNLEKTQNVNVNGSEQYPEELYEKLTRLIIEASKLVNTKARSAIYIINPKNRTYTLQAGNLSQFTDSIKADSPIIRKYMIGNKKLNQKDYPELWSELFFGQDWRGSECAVFSAIKIDNIDAGFILTRFNHFADASEIDCDMYQNLLK